jgi:tRNA pseudouridine55 synthase
MNYQLIANENIKVKMKGIINLYKPSGITSSTAVSAVKRILKERYVGHMGTLDPAGEGILLVGVGKANRLFDLFLSKDKEYEAVFEFGFETDTLDGQGKLLRTSNQIFDVDAVKNACKSFVGKMAQIPPQYSAKSVGGVRAYALARQNKEVELAPSDIEIYELEVIESQPHSSRYTFRIKCSSGTYIRSLCRDIAAFLGTCGTMTAIKRTKCAKYRVENSITLDKLSEIKEEAIESLESVLSFLPSVDLSAFEKELAHGIRIDAKRAGVDIAGNFIVYSLGVLVGIGKIENGKIFIKTYLKD